MVVTDHFRKYVSVLMVLFLAFSAGVAGGRPLTVYFFDVAEADAICIQTPSGKNILIDAGSLPYMVDDRKVESREVLPLLKKYGIAKVDCVVLSHSHGDHAGGMANVLENLAIGKICESGYSSGADDAYREFRDAVRRQGLPYRAVHDGDILDWGAGVTAEVFVPPADAFKGPNDHSLIIRMQYENTVFLFAGDAQNDEEHWVVRKHGTRLRADVLKVGHHGSGTSSSRLFLQAVQPRVAVISCGMDNPFGHPHAQTLYSLKRKKIRTCRTDYDGTVIITVDHDRLHISTEK